ncbi:MAG: NB-ARC domain-containing protein [Caldilineaceae bacterium]
MAESRRLPMDILTSTTLSDFRTLIHETLKTLRKERLTTSPLQSMHLFKATQRAQHDTVQSTIYQIIENGLQELAAKTEVEAKILRQHFLAGKPIQAIATDLNMAEGTVYNKQSEAITHLAEILYAQEEQLRTGYCCALEARLQPPSNSHLVGIDHHLTHLVELLCTPEPPWLIALAGIGGIGKTTLADAVARQAILRAHFDDIGWVTAKQQLFHAHRGLRAIEQPALSADTLMRTLINQLQPEIQLTPTMTLADLQQILCPRLNQRPHLIIVDNLETLADTEMLVDTLRDLANPTKFLLTSRASLFHETDVYHYPVPELPPVWTLSLVRQEARLRNLPDLLHASDADLQPLIETVGGNPLAIRLVVGQGHIHALDTILENLRTACGQTTEQFYTYIYRQAWDALDETARRVLLVMPLVSSLGGTLAHITKVSQMDAGAVTDALTHLVRLNLVDSRGDLHTRRYTIHNLTATFLQEQVIRWGALP